MAATFFPPAHRRGLRTALALAVAAVVLAACSFVNEALWPPVKSGPPDAGTTAAASTRIDIPPSAAERAATGQAAAPAPPAGQPATAVGQRAGQLLTESQRLQQQVQQHNATLQDLRAQNTDTAARFQTLVAQISARLQVGTTPGNPILQAQWAQAYAELDRFAANIGSLSQLANAVAGDASLGGFLTENARNSFQIAGAVEDDHRRLAAVEDDVGRTLVTVDRMRTELSEDIARHSAYVSQERGNMNALSNAIRAGEFFGPGLANRSFAAAPAAAQQPAPSGTAARRPLVVIKFDRANPGFEQALYAAVNRALEIRPQAQFDVVGVAAGRGGAGDTAIAGTNARRQAEQVMRSLVDMGLPAQRLRMSSTTSGGLATNEVQVFVR